VVAAVAERGVASVRVDQTVKAAFEAAATAEDRFTVVTEGGGRVVGVLSDGDIRRAALRGVGMDTPAGDILSAAPILCDPDQSDDDVRELLRAHRLPAVAVVDAEQRLVGVRRMADLDPDAVAAAVGVLMVGGRGERLRPLTDKMPKPLLRVGGQAIVERLIRSFHRAGVRDVYLTLNYMAEEFEERLGDGSRLGVRLHYIRETEAMDTAGSLSLLEPPTTPVLVSNGDLVTTVDFAAMVDFHRYHGADITVAGVEYAAQVPYGVLRTAEHHLLHIDEKPTLRQLVSGGMYVLQPEVLRYVPGDRPYKMTDLIDAVLRDGGTVTVFPLLERWSDIGTRDEFERVLFEFAVEEDG
jgi:dTDP-glucose pyrophosphorylase/CBS domain-containing protein